MSSSLFLLRKNRVASLLVTALIGLTANAWGLTLRLSDPDPTYGPFAIDPCLRGDEDDRCSITGYFHADVVPDNSFEVFDQGFRAWNTTQPADAQWTLKNGGDLDGEIEVTLFRTGNYCPGPSGVEIRAFYHPFKEGGDIWWKWSQGLYVNYEPGPVPPHDSAAMAPHFKMDSNTDGDNSPPLYPFSYADGHFYDFPKVACLHEQTMFFHAVCLISTADFKARTLTTYGGFEYGFDYECVHNAVPEPASMAALGIGVAALSLRRRKR